MQMPENDVVFFRMARPSASAGQSDKPLRLAVIGNFPPRRCGIASFTADMVGAIQQAAPDARIEIHAMTTDPTERPSGPVSRMIVEDDPASYRQSALAIARGDFDAVWVQHEFGIFGGEAGEMVIDLLAPIAAPLIVTLHTVLENPTPSQRRVMDWLVGHASRLVVMAGQGAETLLRVYGAGAKQVCVIEHGVPDRPFGRGEAMKRQFGLVGRRVLMTFGLLSPGKGIETAIAALARILPRHPEATYVIAGATHPKLVAREGEAYRESLKALARELGVADRIRWVESYLDTPELLDLIEAADVYLTPYIGPAQSTSGTLSYAVALGKAVVSTPYVHARELLADGHGVLTPFGDAGAMADAVSALLDDPAALEALQRRAYRRGRTMTWPSFGLRSRELVESVRIPASQEAAPPLLSHRGLEALCDDTGIMQHSVLSIPDRLHGYCVDDNARALMLANLAGGAFARRAPTFAAFVQHSWNPDTRRFRNFMGFDRSWRESVGSEDSSGRTLWTLGATASDAESAGLRAWANGLWRHTAGIALEFGSPRAIAFAMLGADRHLEAEPHDRQSQAILSAGAARLSQWLQQVSRPGWCWFEPVLAYDNCRLPEALLAAARRLGDEAMARRALAALEWIAVQQTSPAGHFRPVGSESFGTATLPPLPFDQQPVDAWATVDAAAAAWRHTRSPHWLEVAGQAYAWFFGANDRGLAVADGVPGACRDGVTPQGLNLNQGAESVLALHFAAHAMAALRREAEPEGAVLVPAGLPVPL